MIKFGAHAASPNFQRRVVRSGHDAEVPAVNRSGPTQPSMTETQN